MFARVILFSAIAAGSIAISACGGSGGNTAVSNANSNASASNANTDPLATKPMSGTEVVNDAPTLTPLIKAYCDAKIKNDEAALRKIFTSDTLRNFEEQMKDEDIKTLVEFLQDEKVSDKRCEVKNEKIMGDAAVARIFIDSYPNGSPEIYFEKENGEWKMTNKSPSFEAKKAANANAAK